MKPGRKKYPSDSETYHYHYHVNYMRNNILDYLLVTKSDIILLSTEFSHIYAGIAAMPLVWCDVCLSDGWHSAPNTFTHVVHQRRSSLEEVCSGRAQVIGSRRLH